MKTSAIMLISLGLDNFISFFQLTHGLEESGNVAGDVIAFLIFLKQSATHVFLQAEDALVVVVEVVVVAVVVVVVVVGLGDN